MSDMAGRLLLDNYGSGDPKNPALELYSLKAGFVPRSSVA
jgi:hypothetical protein